MAETKKTTKTAAAKAPAKAPAKKVASAPAKKASTAASAKKTTKVVEPSAVIKDKQPEKVAEVKVAKKATKQIKVTYTKSVIGYDKRQAKVLQSLGLKKLHSFAVLPDNACTRGMVHKVAHLVTVEEVK